MIQPSVPNPIIVHFELVHSPHIWDLEHGFINTISVLLQSGADERVNTDKLQLDVIGIKRLPLAILQLFNLDSVHLMKKLFTQVFLNKK